MLPEIKEIIEQQEDLKQEKLNQIYSYIKEVLPHASEKIAWSMPTFYDHGNIIHFYPHKNHIGLYPGAEAILKFQEELKNYSYTKGAIQFPYKDGLNKELIQKITRFCDEKLKQYNLEKQTKKIKK